MIINFGLVLSGITNGRGAAKKEGHFHFHPKKFPALPYWVKFCAKRAALKAKRAALKAKRAALKAKSAKHLTNKHLQTPTL